MLMRLCAVASVVVAATPVRAAEFEAAIGRTGYGRCHMLSCGFFVIDDAIPIGSGRDGALFALSVRNWSNEYRDRPNGNIYDTPPKIEGKPDKSNLTFIYCSKTRPTIFDYADGKWQSTLLRVGKESAIFGATESAHSFYYAACHNFITRDPVASEMATKFGYKFPQEKGDATDDTGSANPLSMLN